MFSLLKLGTYDVIKNLNNTVYKPSTACSKYIEIKKEEIVDGRLPVIELRSGNGMPKQLYGTTFMICFHPDLRLGTHFVERDLTKEDQVIFDEDWSNIRLSVSKIANLSWICRIYKIKEM